VEIHKEHDKMTDRKHGKVRVPEGAGEELLAHF
jgi:hypothetical protein